MKKKIRITERKRGRQQQYTHTHTHTHTPHTTHHTHTHTHTHTQPNTLLEFSTTKIHSASSNSFPQQRRIRINCELVGRWVVRYHIHLSIVLDSMSMSRSRSMMMMMMLSPTPRTRTILITPVNTIRTFRTIVVVCWFRINQSTIAN